MICGWFDRCACSWMVLVVMIQSCGRGAVAEVGKGGDGEGARKHRPYINQHHYGDAPAVRAGNYGFMWEGMLQVKTTKQKTLSRDSNGKKLRLRCDT